MKRRCAKCGRFMRKICGNCGLFARRSGVVRFVIEKGPMIRWLYRVFHSKVEHEIIRQWDSTKSERDA
jgi:hypothetical protein